VNFKVPYNSASGVPPGGTAKRSRKLDREYDLFEALPDGSFLWRGTISGHQAAIQKLRELGAAASNELRLIHLPTQTVIATINSPNPA
jgi:hypothetical protein